VFFEGLVDLVHGGGALAVHQTAVFVKEFFRINGTVPQFLCGQIKVQIAENVVVGFRFKESAVKVGGAAVEESAQMTGHHGRDAGDVFPHVFALSIGPDHNGVAHFLCP
jgi:hypothetical protein